MDQGQIEYVWELSKENVQPLARGRKVSTLNKALQCKVGMSPKKGLSDSSYNNQINSKAKDFEQQIILATSDFFQSNQDRNDNGTENSSDNNNNNTNSLQPSSSIVDPLDIWVNYIRFIQENYPSSGETSKLFLVLECAVKTFCHTASYKNDPRFVRLCLAYADRTRDPQDVFSFLEANGIGQDLAIFYERWAAFLEDRKNYSKVDQVYEMGIHRAATQPKDKEWLMNRRKAFQARMGARIQDQSQSPSDPNYDQGAARGASSSGTNENNAIGTAHRPVMGKLSTSQASKTLRPITIGLGTMNSRNQGWMVPNKAQSKKSQNTTSFEIFNDDTFSKQQQHKSNTDSRCSSIPLTSASTSEIKTSMISNTSIKPAIMIKLKNPFPNFPVQSQVSKENEGMATSWDGVKVAQKRPVRRPNGTTASTSLKFDVYVDEGLSQNVPKNVENMDQNSRSGSVLPKTLRESVCDPGSVDARSGSFMKEHTTQRIQDPMDALYCVFDVSKEEILVALQTRIDNHHKELIRHKENQGEEPQDNSQMIFDSDNKENKETENAMFRTPQRPSPKSFRETENRIKLGPLPDLEVSHETGTIEIGYSSDEEIAINI